MSAQGDNGAGAAREETGKTLRVGVDAMGGDYAPEAVVLGAIDAVARLSGDVRLVLFGDQAAIRAIMAREGVPDSLFDIVPTTEVITMSDHPAQAFTKKPDSSLTVGFGHLKAGRIDGFASAGNTGAMLVGSMYTVKSIEGVIRPTISSHIPVVGGRTALLLDVGLNVDCKPDVLDQYGMLGSIYAEKVLGIPNPRVALLNIGEEKEKGNLATKAAYEIMEGTTKFNFVGNIEGKQIFTGDVADVIVCDGFVGNIVLKQAEGMYDIIRRLGASENEFSDGLNYENIGGTPVLGINAAVTVGHGRSTPKAICNMILQTEKTVRSGIVALIKQRVS
ncbi:MAG: phosphate acyltransferase PlsX [Alistipes sp.]|jgi:glycerol-3-phosphate acyltransferase PlsX|nr:phosphate acyltransferase PlsX [Alistipes sp.]